MNFQIPDAWEVKDVVNRLKNVVLNYTKMETKVHEATNNEPWGASGTLLQEIAQGTYNYQYFNEIMPTVYTRFTEKESKQWRQIYKALVLLEYLIKNGSERVVDDARSHVPMIKVMRNFYYIDDKGKDEGLNVRNRAKEIVDLLGNTDKIRSERKLAKNNRDKYTGYGQSKYVGFGNDSYSAGGGGLSFNGDALNFGEETPYPHQSDGYDQGGGYHSDSNEDSSVTKKTTTNDFDVEQSNDDDWGDFTWGGEPKETPANVLDDDFADFQHAVVADETTPKKLQDDLFDLFETNPPLTPASQHQQPKQAEKKVDESPIGMWAQASNFVSLDSLGNKAETNPQPTGPSMNALKNTSVQQQATSKQSPFDDLL